MRVIPVSLALMVIDCEVAVFCNADISASNLVNYSLRVMHIHLLVNRGSFSVLALSRFAVGFIYILHERNVQLGHCRDGIRCLSVYTYKEVGLACGWTRHRTSSLLVFSMLSQYDCCVLTGRDRFEDPSPSYHWKEQTCCVKNCFLSPPA